MSKGNLFAHQISHSRDHHGFSLLELTRREQEKMLVFACENRYNGENPFPEKGE
ncbi:MAG: hypothetical protein AB1564_11690 [Chloroflexota bacterium]